MTKTLLEQAKELAKRKNDTLNITDEHIELAIAWMKNEISLVQFCEVLNIDKKQSYVAYSKITQILKHAYIKGDLIIKK